jgi:cGMP-dependent protein kinase
LVKDRQNQEYVAKTMRKYDLEEAEVCEFIIDESKVMASVSFPFVVRCGKMFQSKHHLVYLTEYVKGE